MQNPIDAYLEALDLLAEMKDPRVLAALAPSGVRGLVLHRGKQGVPTQMPATHTAHFDWTYPDDHARWPSSTAAPSAVSGSPSSSRGTPTSTRSTPRPRSCPEEFVNFEPPEKFGVSLDAKEQQRVLYCMATWMLSQFLHGEQGASSPPRR